MKQVLISSLLITTLLTACGGGGSGGGLTPTPDENTGDNSSNTNQNSNINSTLLANVSGTIRSAAFTIVDSDTNDLNSPFIANNNFSSAQSLTNPTSLNGYVNYTTTSSLNDRFGPGSQGDAVDMYDIQLQAGQTIRLRNHSWSATDTNRDIVMQVYDKNKSMIAATNNNVETAAISVENAGDYFIMIMARCSDTESICQLPFKGYKYTITVDSSTATSQEIAGTIYDFVPMQAIVKNKASLQQPRSVNQHSIKQSTAVKQQTSTTKTHRGFEARYRHNDKARAVLASLSTKRDALSTRSNTHKPTLAVLKTLAEENPKSYEKFLTLQHIAELRQDNTIESAEVNALRQASIIPNDTYYSYQWHYPLIKLPQAWDLVQNNAAYAPIVAVVDTGIIAHHPEFSGQFVSGYDFISDITNAGDGNGLDNNPDDPGDSREDDPNTEEDESSPDSWHGTHVSGTIVANSNNLQGISGVAWLSNTKVMPLRALGKLGGSTYDILQAVRYAAGLPNDSGTVPAKRADIINLSLGGPDFSFAEQNLFNQIHNLGITVVAAAGNESTTAPSYPAAYNHVISVSAIDGNKQIAPYSNTGTSVDIAAPGGNLQLDVDGDGRPDGVLSTFADSDDNRSPIYVFAQGTSMAAPHVSGVLALMKSVNPNLTVQQLESLLVNCQLTNRENNCARDNQYGYGVLDAFNAVKNALALINNSEIPAAFISEPSSINFGRIIDNEIIRIKNIGDEPGEITSITTNVDWLTISPHSQEDSNTFLYTISINRDNLNDGIYSATITVETSTGATFTIPVSARIGSPNIIANAGYLYLHVQNTQNASLSRILSLPSDNGVYRYSVENLPHGNYWLYATSDINNDGKICDSGEACGSYPNISLPTPLTVDGDKTRIDFSVSIPVTISEE